MRLRTLRKLEAKRCDCQLADVVCSSRRTPEEQRARDERRAKLFKSIGSSDKNSAAQKLLNVFTEEDFNGRTEARF